MFGLKIVIKHERMFYTISALRVDFLVEEF